jgi:transposase-like protein
VDGKGEVLDVLVQTRRNKRAALKLMVSAFPIAYTARLDTF